MREASSSVFGLRGTRGSRQRALGALEHEVEISKRGSEGGLHVAR